MVFVLRNIAFVVLIMVTFGSWAKTPREIEQELRLSTVFISVEQESSTGAKVTSSGSGFVIKSDGYVLTAGHVIPPGSDRYLKINGALKSRSGTPEEMEFNCT